jgi:NTP pyrophosphatase (non-canonical NTP hydrolase)
MDDTTTIATLKQATKEFCDERDWEKYHNAKELAIGIITEAGELLDNFRFKSPEQVDELFEDPKRRGEIGEELADVLYFVLRMGERYDIDLSEEFSKKMVKNAEKYPVKLVKGKNQKYTEY